MGHCPGVFSLQLVGALLLAAHSHLRWFLLYTSTLSRGTSAEAFPGLLLQFPGRSQKDSQHNHLESDHRAVNCYYGTLFLLLATLGFRMVRRCVDASWTLKSQFVKVPYVMRTKWSLFR